MFLAISSTLAEHIRRLETRQSLSLQSPEGWSEYVVTESKSAMSGTESQRFVFPYRVGGAGRVAYKVGGGGEG